MPLLERVIIGCLFWLSVVGMSGTTLEEEFDGFWLFSNVDLEVKSSVKEDKNLGEGDDGRDEEDEVETCWSNGCEIKELLDNCDLLSDIVCKWTCSFEDKWGELGTLGSSVVWSFSWEQWLFDNGIPTCEKGIILSNGAEFNCWDVLSVGV